MSRLITNQDVRDLEAKLKAELPGFAIGYKDENQLQKRIGRVVRPFNSTYMTNYTTVLFGVVWFPSRHWRAQVGPRAIYEILLHEAVHLRDARRFWGFFHLSYLFLPLPAFVTLRAWWEWRAYAETMRVTLELDGEIPDSLLDHIERCFTSSDYLYMWPFRTHLRGHLERLRTRLLRTGP
ncbi:MAG: hypothetical protein KC502_02535 [Myxococcales bacterium]|nr:hypothetical protein [Myxococcales bacterium]